MFFYSKAENMMVSKMINVSGVLLKAIQPSLLPLKHLLNNLLNGLRYG